MENKMTNKKALEFVKANFTLPEDVAEKIDNMILAIEKKAANKKPSKTAVENETLKVVAYDALKALGKASTVTEIMTSNPTLSVLSTPKVSALMKLLKEDDLVERSEEKGKALFSVK